MLPGTRIGAGCVHSLVLCLFGNVPPEIVAGLVNSACGYEYEVTDLLKCGERGWNLKRAINNRMGLTRANDKLPKALTPAVG